MKPRDVVKLAFQFTEHSEIPFTMDLSTDQEQELSRYYGNEDWKKQAKPYMKTITGVDNFLSAAGFEKLSGRLRRDCFGCVWDMGSTHHLVEAPLKEPRLNGYTLPDIDVYFDKHVRNAWEREIASTSGSFRIIGHSFGLFERCWSLRGFEEFLIDLCYSPAFCEELIETVADWMIKSIDNMLEAPVDAIMLTDDYADQRGVIFGIDRFRKFFKPHWKRIFARIKKAGVYSILHVCGNALPAVGDLIECGLDCLESLQPEAMDVFRLKKEYGKDIRLWGGLGAQSTLPFGTADDVRREVRRLRSELGSGGGYVLAPAKPFSGYSVPVENIAMYLEEALLH